MKKVFSMFLVLMMVLGLFAVCSLSAMASGDVTILFTANMGDASQEEYDAVAAVKDNYDGALLVDAGGYSGDSVDAMNAAGYDLAADGAAGSFTVISLAASGSNGGAALSCNGSTVAFVSLSRPADTEDEAYYEAVQSIVDQAQSNGVSYVVGIGVGIDASGVAANVTGLDAILTGAGGSGSAGLGQAMVCGANGGVGVLTLSGSGVSCSVESIAVSDGASEEPVAEDEEEPAEEEETADEETVDEETADEEDTAEEEELPAAEVIENPDADAASESDLVEAPVSGSDAEETDTGDKSSDVIPDESEDKDDTSDDEDDAEDDADDDTDSQPLPDETVETAEPTATAVPTATPAATPAVAVTEFVKGNNDLVLTASAPVTAITYTYTGLVNGVATSITATLDTPYYTTSGNTATIKASCLNGWGNGTYTFNLKQASGETNIKVKISGTAPATTNTDTGSSTGSASGTATTADNAAGTQTTTTTITTTTSTTTANSNAAATTTGATPAAVTAAASTASAGTGVLSLVPGTGDTTQILPWVIGLVVLALALVVVVVILKKRQAR